MTFRVEETLRADFAQAAGLKDRPAAQLLREFMRDYVAQNSPRPAPTITAADREHRREAVEYARGSVGLEGFKISPAAAKRAERFINGEIDLEELVKVSHDAK